jgi:hypothetical protein
VQKQKSADQQQVEAIINVVLEEYGCEWGPPSYSDEGVAMVVQAQHRRGELLDYRRLRTCMRALDKALWRHSFDSRCIVPMELVAVRPLCRFTDLDYEGFLFSFEGDCVACRDAKHGPTMSRRWENNQVEYTPEGRWVTLAHFFAMMGVRDTTADDQYEYSGLETREERLLYNSEIHAMLVKYGLIDGLRIVFQADLLVEDEDVFGESGLIAEKAWTRACLEHFLTMTPNASWVQPSGLVEKPIALVGSTIERFRDRRERVALKLWWELECRTSDVGTFEEAMEDARYHVLSDSITWRHVTRTIAEINEAPMMHFRSVFRNVGR